MPLYHPKLKRKENKINIKSEILNKERKIVHVQSVP